MTQGREAGASSKLQGSHALRKGNDVAVIRAGILFRVRITRWRLGLLGVGLSGWAGDRGR